MKNICKNPGPKEILPPVIILLFTIITRFHRLTGSMRMPFTDRTFGSNGVDEGIFLMTGKLVSEGYRMYSDVNTQQGPLFSFVFSAIGGDPFGARFITATIAVIGVATLFYLSKRSGNTRAAVISSLFLASNYLFFKESRHVSFDLYSAVFLLLGFAAIMIYYDFLKDEVERPLSHSKIIATIVISGVFLSMAAMSKLFAVIPTFFLGAYMLVDCFKKDRGVRLSHIVILVISTLITTILLMSIFGPANTLEGMLLDNLNRPDMSLGDKAEPLGQFLLYALIPIILSIVAIKKDHRKKDTRLMLIWFVPLFIYLVIQSPIWDHYFVLLVPPVSYLGGKGFDLLSDNPSNGSDQRDMKYPFKGKDTLSSTLVVIGIVYIVITTGITTAFTVTAEDPIQERIGEDIGSLTSEGDFIISGDPLIGVYADRLQPPEATNLAKVRYPELTDADLINITVEYDVRVVIFTYHLSVYDEYLHFVESNFRFHGSYDRDGDFSSIKGDIGIGKRTYSVFVIDD